MNTIERATRLLEGFIADPEQRVMALKGPWGVGKSYFVRHFLEKNRKEQGPLPTYLSYASVFGLHNVQEVQSIISRCVEHTSPTEGKKWMKKAVKYASETGAKLSVAGIGIDLAGLGDSAYWHLARSKGLFIVIDDIERAPDLSMEQLLGLASSVTENEHTKVLLVLNSDKLSELSSNIFAQYREKVVGAELLFDPPVREIVERYLEDKLLTDTAVVCLEASKGANIRLIRRINHAIRQFRQAAESYQIPFSDDDLKHIAKLVWLFHVSPAMPDDELVGASWAKTLFRKDEKEQLPPEIETLNKLKRTVSFQTNTFDDLILSTCVQATLARSPLLTKPDLKLKPPPSMLLTVALSRFLSRTIEISRLPTLN